MKEQLELINKYKYFNMSGKRESTKELTKLEVYVSQMKQCIVEYVIVLAA